jgi:hypothetical protein
VVVIAAWVVEGSANVVDGEVVSTTAAVVDAVAAVPAMVPVEASELAQEATETAASERTIKNLRMQTTLRAVTHKRVAAAWVDPRRTRKSRTIRRDRTLRDVFYEFHLLRG